MSARKFLLHWCVSAGMCCRHRINVAAAISLAALALLAAGCGGGGAPGGRVAELGSTVRQGSSFSNAPSASTRNGADTFARCMRSNGVSGYPDPDSSGHLVKESLQQLGVSGARFQEADRECRHLLPNDGQPASEVVQQRITARSLSFAGCVRAHGVPSFPDPGSDGRIPDPASVGIDQGSPLFEAANTACGKYRPPYLPSNAAYNAWARTRGSGS